MKENEAKVRMLEEWQKSQLGQWEAKVVALQRENGDLRSAEAERERERGRERERERAKAAADRERERAKSIAERERERERAADREKEIKEREEERVKALELSYSTTLSELEVCVVFEPMSVPSPQLVSSHMISLYGTITYCDLYGRTPSSAGESNTNRLPHRGVTKVLASLWRARSMCLMIYMSGFVLYHCVHHCLSPSSLPLFVLTNLLCLFASHFARYRPSLLSPF